MLCPGATRGAFTDNARPIPEGRNADAMAQYIYTMNRVSKVVPPKRTILRDISLSFFPGAKIGVLGLNGSGKSTLLRIMAGVDTNIDGEARAQSGIRVGFLTQEPGLDPTKDVRGNVMEGVGATWKLLERFNQISEAFGEAMDDERMNKLLEEQAKLQDAIDAAGGWELERKLEIAADALRLPPWDARIDQLSGGEKRRVALCRLLLSQPDMLLLDEPTNHLDAESVAWLERYLEEYPSTVIAVTHDRYFLDNVAQWILELDRGHGIPYQGNYSSWLEQKEKRLALEEREQDALRKTLARELEWVRANPKARQAKSKARLARYEELASREFQERNETNEIYIPPGPRLGDSVIEVENLRKGFGERLLIDKLSFRLPPGGIVGIIGPNGAGKTTLFRMLTGAEQPDGGEIRIGSTVKLAYVDQSRQSLDDSKSVWAEISGGQDIIRVDNYETPSRAYVGRFNFKGSQQQQLIGELSGGERNRVHLAKVLRSGGNVLLLDEPTNDLDVETLRALEEALVNFPGCAVVISHDRWFLDRIATHILAFEGDSEVVWFEGNYQEYAADLRARRGEDADQPHRLKYKRLTG
jgi:sulfate-transporting ATPase